MCKWPSSLSHTTNTSYEVKAAQSYSTLCDPIDYIVHGILQARILEWAAPPFFMGSSWPRNWTGVSLHCRQILYQLSYQGSPKHGISSVAQLCLPLCDPINCSTPGLPVNHQLSEFTQTHVHRVGDAIQLSHPLWSPSPPVPQSLPESESFPMSQLFAWGGLSIGASALALLLPMNTQLVNVVYYIDWFADIEGSLHPWDKAHLVMMYDLLNALLDSDC